MKPSGMPSRVVFSDEDDANIVEVWKANPSVATRHEQHIYMICMLYKHFIHLYNYLSRHTNLPLTREREREREGESGTRDRLEEGAREALS